MILSLALGPWPASALVGAARDAERAGVDLLLAGYPLGGLQSGVLPDNPARLDPLSLVSALIGLTSRVGLAAVVPAAGWAPFNVARAFSALDNLSDGRAGWFAIPGEGSDADPGGERFAEHLEAAFALMESWDADALVLDKDAGLFTDPAKVRRIAHAGRHFTIDGPLNSPRSPQGRPVLLQAAGPGADRAEVLVARPAGIDAAPGVGGAGCRLIVDLAFSLTDATVGAGASLAFAGHPQALAGLMRAWVVEGACDGFNLLPASPEDVAIFADRAAPPLHAEGLIHDAGAATLRARLGLGQGPAPFSATA